MNVPNKEKPALIIDTPSIFATGFYASQKSDEVAHLDMDRRAACCALAMLLPIIGGWRLEQTYTRVLFCWDGKRKTDKKRSDKPEGYHEALDYFKGVVSKLFGGTSCTPPNFESDDAVATAAIRMAERGVPCCVVSGDKDLHQLIGGTIRYYCIGKKSMLTAQHICERRNLYQPCQIAVWLAVVGDSNDGIGGVVQWGEKRWKDRIFAALDPKDDLATVIAKVEQIIPLDQVQNFYTSLENTLLHTEVPDVPEPGEIKLVALDVLDEEGVDHVRSLYARMIGEFGNTEEMREYDRRTSASEADREY